MAAGDLDDRMKRPFYDGQILTFLLFTTTIRLNPVLIFDGQHQ